MRSILVGGMVAVVLTLARIPPQSASADTGKDGGFSSELAKRASSKYQEQLSLIDGEFIAKVKKVGEAYAKELEEARKAALTKGDLDEAQRILTAQNTARESPVARLPFHGLSILTARWGAQSHWIDVTPQVQNQMKDSKLSLVPEEMDFPDPIDGTRKALVVVFSLDGKIDVAIVAEGQPLSIPAKSG